MEAHGLPPKGEDMRTWCPSANPALAFLVCVISLFAVGCGVENRGEPRSVAEKLSKPSLGDVHVYCVPTASVPVTVCDVRLDATGPRSRSALAAWWLRASRALVGRGAFRYGDGEWRFETVILEADGVWLGWRCRGDLGRTREEILDAMRRRNPGVPGGITTASEAAKRWCVIAVQP